MLMVSFHPWDIKHFPRVAFGICFPFTVQKPLAISSRLFVDSHITMTLQEIGPVRYSKNEKHLQPEVKLEENNVNRSGDIMFSPLSYLELLRPL